MTPTESRIDRLLSSPQSSLLGGFAGVILIGALLLWLPWSQGTGNVTFVDALFTSTSAVCVTGLTTVDTSKDFTRFGQVVILLLIQTGGLGVMTFAGLFFYLAGRKISLQAQALVSDSFFQRDIAAHFWQSFHAILSVTVAIEGLGALVLFLAMWPRLGWGEAVFSAVFHSVSAFCNAGFSIQKENLVEFRDSHVVLFTIMALIVLGGVGYMVLLEVGRRVLYRVRGSEPSEFSGLSLHARLVIRISAILIVGGAAFLMLFGLTSQEVSWWDHVVHSLFQSVSARTAGFNSLDIGRLPSASLLVLILLMFIGGSPGSCAGGVKTTAVAIYLARLEASLKGRTECRLMDRSLREDLVRKVDCLLSLALLWNIVGVFFLLKTQEHLSVQALELFFEQISAFGTVGLSTGITPKLNDTGKLWIIATMYLGRLGPLTIALWAFGKDRAHVGYPKGTVMIG
ncbi:MAG: potassium transporter TrkG [Thermodesulfobacteriota bacterium]